LSPTARTAPPLTLRTDPDMMRRIEAAAQRFGVSKNDVVNIALAGAIARSADSQDPALVDPVAAAILAIMRAPPEDST
jgi:hypothetical protein